MMKTREIGKRTEFGTITLGDPHGGVRGTIIVTLVESNWYEDGGTAYEITVETPTGTEWPAIAPQWRWNNVLLSIEDFWGQEEWDLQMNPELENK